MDDLDSILKKARTPEPRPGFEEEFSQSVLRQLNRAPAASGPEKRPWFPRLAWGLTAAAACILAGFAIGHWRGRESARADLLQNTHAIHEMLAMFPHRVRAVVQDEHGVRLVLAEGEDVPASEPLWIEVCDGKSCRSMVTFSGQEVQIGGQPVEVLADPQGQVTLVGNDFFWSNETSVRTANNLRIQAKALDRPGNKRG